MLVNGALVRTSRLATSGGSAAIVDDRLLAWFRDLVPCNLVGRSERVPGLGIEADEARTSAWSGVRITASLGCIRLMNENLIDGGINVVSMGLVMMRVVRWVMVKLDVMRVD